MNNEEQMKADFELYCSSAGLPWPGTDSTFYRMWKAATTSKHREIDTLNRQVLELSAQVNDLHEALVSVLDRPFEIKAACDARRLLSTTPPAALQARDNEVAANALEEAADHEDLYSKRDVLRRIASELRNRK